MYHRRVASFTIAALLATATASCVAPDSPAPEEERVFQLDGALTSDTVVAGGPLSFRVDGAAVLIPFRISAVLDGELNERALRQTFDTEFRNEDGAILVDVPWQELETTVGGGARFVGNITILVEDIGGALIGIAAIRAVDIDFVPVLTPSITLPADTSIYLGEVTEWPATGLLRPSEGTTHANVVGTFTADDDTVRDVDTTLPLLESEERTVASIPWRTALGIKPGQFSGTLRLINTHTHGGDAAEGDATPIELTLLRSEVDGFSPASVGRGGIVTMTGRGLVPSDDDSGSAMFVMMEGAFSVYGTNEVVDLTGAEALQLVPEDVPDHRTAHFAMRTETLTVDGLPMLTGISARPGRFDGTITTVFVSGSDTVLGHPFVGSIDIAPTRQYVWVRFLPEFSESLAGFGLSNVEPDIRDRAFDIVTRDYDGYNIEFSDRQPMRFAEYTTIEIGGTDPNNVGFFGLDNTAGKDTGNVRLNDYIGGRNATSEEAGYFAYGGVFIDSFRTLSPTLDPSSVISSPRFDDIMTPFMPELGGVAISADELQGDRKAEIDMAVHAFGGVIGNTITHEIGHSLGLAFFEEDLTEVGEEFHNAGDTPGAIMDGGTFRPFEERAEIDGAPTPFFNEASKAYLEWVIPAER